MAFQFVRTAPNVYGFTYTWPQSSGAPTTMVAWIYPDSLPANAGVVKITLEANGDTNGLQTVNNTATAISVDQGTASDTRVAPGTLSTGAWAHVGATFHSAADRTAWLNGAGTYGFSGGILVGAPDSVYMGHSTTGGAWDGRLAGVALWDADLTLSELNSLAKGFSPRRVRPQSLRVYTPLIRDLRELRQNLAPYAPWIVYNPTTVHPHPRQYGF